MSNEIGVKLLTGASYRPGERVEGQAGWQLAKTPRKARIRLFWRTEGKGTEDLTIVAEQPVESPQAAQLVDFAFDLPPMPYSYHGVMLSIRWGVEAVVDRTSECVWFDMGPDGRPCRSAGLRTGAGPEPFPLIPGADSDSGR